MQLASTPHSSGDGMDIAVRDGRWSGSEAARVIASTVAGWTPKDCYGWCALMIAGP